MTQREKLIFQRLQEHYNESLQYFPEDQIVGIFLQGSQNYGLDYDGSDVDTQLIVVPSFKDFCLNKEPVSTTHVRANNEHTNWKDIRLYIETFRKQNLNFLEILFTDFYIVNPMYAGQWHRLVAKREEIARMNVYRAVKSMKGIAFAKYEAMELRYPSKADIIDKYGYDGKQVSHIIRIDDFLGRYINGESYLSCMHPAETKRKKIIDYKLLDKIDLETARAEAKKYVDHAMAIADAFCKEIEEEENQEMRDLLEDVSYNIMKIAIKKEFEEEC